MEIVFAVMIIMLSAYGYGIYKTHGKPAYPEDCDDFDD